MIADFVIHFLQDKLLLFHQFRATAQLIIKFPSRRTEISFESQELSIVMTSFEKFTHLSEV